MKKIAVINNKGGVGKSTVSVQLAHGLAELDFKVILADFDGQNDSSLFLGFSQNDFKKTFYDMFDRRYPVELKECIISARKNLDLLPASNIKEIEAELHRETRIDIVLKEKLQDIETMGYDYAIFDCGPTRSRINDAILCYVDKIVMPVQVEAAAVRGAGNIYNYLSDLRLDPNMIALVIPNMFDQRTNDAKENLQFLEEFFSEGNIVTEPIHRRVKITEAGKMGKTVFEHDAEAAKQFFKVLERLVEKVG